MCFLVQIRDTAHTKCVRDRDIILIEGTTIQSPFIAVTAISCACPYLGRVAVVILGARAAAAVVRITL